MHTSPEGSFAHGWAQRLSAFFADAFANTFANRVGHKALFAVAMLLCITWTGLQALASALHPSDGAASEHSSRQAGVEWPTQWDGAPLQQLALSPVEARFAQDFPGAIGRLTDGQRTLVLRHVTAPTRMLHPATDCFRAVGYRIEQERLERDAYERLWRCFLASRGGQSLRVCERIVDADGRAFTDTSAWFWSAARGVSHGPWRAVTIATPIERELL
ncbi:MAG: hypothetical protein ABIW85_00060 [Variovorax sp.]